MSQPQPRLVLASDRRRAVPLDPATPLTIGSGAGNRLCLASSGGVSEHHAVVRFSRSHGWVVCDWQSSDGTWLEGQRVRQCRPLNDGDEIRLGRQGPVLVFEAATPVKAPKPNARPPVTPASIDLAGQSLPLSSVRTALVRTDPLHPHIFSWWLLLCLGGLLLLPFPLLFWPLQLLGLVGGGLLGARKEHWLVVELRDGRAVRHRFANRLTALAHRNGIRKAIGQAVSQP
jgi:FHA domain